MCSPRTAINNSFTLNSGVQLCPVFLISCARWVRLHFSFPSLSLSAMSNQGPFSFPYLRRTRKLAYTFSYVMVGDVILHRQLLMNDWTCLSVVFLVHLVSAPYNNKDFALEFKIRSLVLVAISLDIHTSFRKLNAVLTFPILLLIAYWPHTHDINNAA